MPPLKHSIAGCMASPGSWLLSQAPTACVAWPVHACNVHVKPRLDAAARLGKMLDATRTHMLLKHTWGKAAAHDSGAPYALPHYKPAHACACGASSRATGQALSCFDHHMAYGSVA